MDTGSFAVKRPIEFGDWTSFTVQIGSRRHGDTG